MGSDLPLPTQDSTESRPLLSESSKQPSFGTAGPENARLKPSLSTSSSLSSSSCPTPRCLESHETDGDALKSLQPTEWKSELRTIATNAKTLIVTFFLQHTLVVTSVFFVGPLGKTQLAAVTLGSLTANITAYCPFVGLNNCLDTLCSQAYGSGNKPLVGLYLQRMCALLLVLCLPVGALWWNCSAILDRIIDDHAVAQYAELYLRVALFGIPAYACFDAGKRYCQAQAIYNATRSILFVCAPLNVFLHWLLVWKLEYGFVGAPMALVITDWAMALGLLVYVSLVDGYQCWAGFDRRALQHWWPMFVMALPSMVMLASEWFAFEVLAFFSSKISSTALAGQSILASVSSIAYAVPFPASIAISNRIAYFIGAGDVHSAKVSTQVGLIVALAGSIHNVFWLTVLRSYLPRVFTNDADVIAVVNAAYPVLIALQVSDPLNTYTSGVLRGIGRQDFGGIVNATVHWIIGLPLAYYICFNLGYGLTGLWLGLTGGLFATGIICAVFILRADWDRCVEAASKRSAME